MYDLFKSTKNIRERVEQDMSKHTDTSGDLNTGKSDS